MGFVFFNFSRQWEGRTNVGAEVIDNNLPFLASVFLFFDVTICKPLIDKADKGIYSTKANGRILVSQLFHSLGVTATTFSMDLTGVVSLVLLFLRSKLKFKVVMLGF